MYQTLYQIHQIISDLLSDLSDYIRPPIRFIRLYQTLYQIYQIYSMEVKKINTDKLLNINHT